MTSPRTLVNELCYILSLSCTPVYRCLGSVLRNQGREQTARTEQVTRHALHQSIPFSITPAKLNSEPSFNLSINIEYAPLCYVNIV